MYTKQLSILLFAAGLSMSAIAQKEEKDIVIKDGKKTETMKILVDGDKVTINGIPSDKWKDEDIEKFRNKKIIVNVHGKNGMDFDMPPFEIETEMLHSNTGFLGVITEKADKGVVIKEVTKESAAAKAGLQKNDIITKVNDTKIESSDDLIKAIGAFKPDTKINISYLRDAKENTVSAVLGKRMETNIRKFKMDKGDFNFKMPHPFSFELGENPPMPPMPGRPRLGIDIQDLEEGNGVKVTDVDEDLPAGKAGLKEDDIITELNGKEIKSVDDLRSKLKELKEGDALKIGIKRNGKSQTIDLKMPKKLKRANL